MTKKPKSEQQKGKKQVQQDSESISNESDKEIVSDEDLDIQEENQQKNGQKNRNINQQNLQEEEEIQETGKSAQKKDKKKIKNKDKSQFQEEKLKEELKKLSKAELEELIEKKKLELALKKQQQQKQEQQQYEQQEQEEIEQQIQEEEGVDFETLSAEEKEKLLRKFKKRGVSWSQNKSVFWDNVCILSFLLLFLVGMGYMKYVESGYNKTVKVSAGGYSDLYEVLDLDSGASQMDIKRSYKKLAKLWHPDLNKDCKNCDEKFQMIAKAYEVLGKPESRNQYDQTRGVTEAITSRAIQLTKRNFENLVFESNDVWIIQIYENSSKLSKQLTPFWESAVDRYQGVVRFGRINRETDPELLKYLPIKVQILPTTISYVNRGEHSQLYIFDRTNPEGSMFKFVNEAIPMKVNIFGKDSAKEVYEKLRSTGWNEKQVDIVYLAQQGKMPIEFKYAAVKFGDGINFHVSKYNDYQKVQYFFGKTSDNFFIFYTDLVSGERKQVSLRMTKKFDNQLFKKFLKLAKFVAVPELDRANFIDNCENLSIRQSDEDYDDENLSQQNLCIVINSDDKAVLQEVNRVREETVQEISKNLKSLNQQNEKFFESFDQIMFVKIDREHNWFFEKSLRARKDNEFPFERAFLYAILAENRKISYPKSIIGIEDWLYDLFDNDGNNLEYLNDYLPEEMMGIEIAHLLKFKDDTPQQLFIRSIQDYLTDWKVWVTSIMIYLGTSSFYKRKNIQSKLPNNLFFASIILISVISSFMDNFQEFYH